VRLAVIPAKAGICGVGNESISHEEFLMIDADRILDKFLDGNHKEVIQMDTTNRQLLGDNYYALCDYGTVNLIALSYHSTNNFSEAKTIAEGTIGRLKKEVLPERRYIQSAVTVLILSYFELSMPAKSYHYALIYLKYGFEEENALRVIDIVRNKVVGKYPFIILIVSTLIKYFLRFSGFHFADSNGFRIAAIGILLLSLFGIIWRKKFVHIYTNTVEKLLIKYFVKL